MDDKANNSEQKYGFLINNILDVIMEMDLDGTILFQSPQVYELLGYFPEEGIGKNGFEYVHPDDEHVLKTTFARTIQDYSMTTLEFRLKHKNGYYVPVSVRGRMVKNNSNYTIMMVIRDVAERKVAEQQLKESEEKFRLIADQSLVGIHILQDDVFKYANQATARITGYSIEELLNFKPREFVKMIHPDDLDFVMEQSIKKQAGKKDIVLNYSFKSIKKDGSLQWMELYSKTIMWEGRPADMIISIDINERKLAEERLKESEEKFRVLADQSLVGIHVLQDDVFKYANQAIAVMTGYSVEEFLNFKPREFAKLIHHDDLNFVMEQGRKKQAGEKNVEENYSFRLIKKDGNSKWIEIYSNTIMWEGRTADMVISIDINERKLVEEKYRLISETANDMIMIINDKFEIEYRNEETSYNILGYTKEEVIGKSVIDRIHPDDREHAFKIFRESIKKGEGQVEVRTKHKDGHWIWVDIKGKTFIDEQGQNKAILISRDITERKIAEQKLRESEEKYRVITESANDIISIINENFELEYQNEEATYNILGYTNEEILSQPALERLHPDEVKSVTKVFREGFRTGEAQVEMRTRHKDGHYVWFDIKGRTFRNEHGEQKGIIVSRDITERRNAEQQLRESEEKYRSLFETAPDGIALTAMDGKFLEVNPAFQKMLGYAKDDLNVLKYQDLTPEKWHIIEAKRIQEIMDIGYGTLEKEFIRKDGTIVPISLTGWVIKDNEGNPTTLGAYIEDITERKKAQEKLKESEEKFRQISEQALLGIAIIQDGQIKYINDAALSVNEYSREEVLSWKEYELFKTIHPDDTQYMMHKLKEYEAGEAKGQTRHFIFRVISKSGKVKWIEQTTNPIVYHGRNATVNFSSEITARMEAQEKLKEAFERETFFKNLFTHDINNVLNNIQSSLSLFTLYQNNPEKQEEIIKIVNILKEQVVRGSHLVSNIRQLSEVEEGMLPLENVDAMKFLKDGIKQVQEGFQTRIIDVKIDSSEDVILVQANNLLLNVFENILNNAVKYNKHPIVEIIIRITKNHDEGVNYLKFEFMDNGIGIDDFKKATIFKEGYKKEKDAKGLGFGLTLVKKIITSYKGRIWVEDKIQGNHSKGSNFVLLIPLS